MTESTIVEEEVFDAWEDDSSAPETDQCKWIADGSETLEEVIECFEGFLYYLKDNLAAGWQLSQPVQGGYLCYDRVFGWEQTMKKILFGAALAIGSVVMPLWVAQAASLPAVSHLTQIVRGTTIYVSWRNNPLVTNITVWQDGTPISYGPITSYGRQDFSVGPHQFCVAPSDGTAVGHMKCITAVVA